MGGNICSDIQGVWTERSQNKYFPYGQKSQSIRTLLYTYPNKTV